jgi:hypothetical protein
MKSEVACHLVAILFKVSTSQFMKYDASQFQNVGVNFHKSQALFSTRP